MTFDEFEACVVELERQLATFDFFLFSEIDWFGRHVGDWVAERAELIRADFGSEPFDPDDSAPISLWVHFRRVESSPKPHVRRVKTFKGGARFLLLETHNGSQITMFRVSDTDEAALRMMAPLREARELGRERHDQVTRELIKAALTMIREGHVT